jgi:hypothetical protein
LSGEPRIDPTATIQGSTLGAWTVVGARSSIAESCLGDYSYVVSDCQVIYSRIGKFCSIAAQSRLNPGNHPLGRVAMHHFTYRSASYEMGPDDPDFFDWRRERDVVLGHDVWIGHLDRCKFWLTADTRKRRPRLRARPPFGGSRTSGV